MRQRQVVWRILLSVGLVASAAQAQGQEGIPPELLALLVEPSEPPVPRMIAGQIVDENQRPLAGVEVVVLESNENDGASQRVASATSDLIGHYQIPLGEWTQRRYPQGKVLPVDWVDGDPPLLTIVAKAPGRASFRVGVSSADAVNLGDVTDIMLPPAASLRGVVTKADGTPVSGAVVSATVGVAWPRIDDGIFRARTDAQGRYEIADLIAFSQDEPTDKGRPVAYGMVKATRSLQLPGLIVGDDNHINLTVEHPDFAVKHMRCKRVPGEVNVSLDPAAILSGRVVAASGSGVSEALVCVASVASAEPEAEGEGDVGRRYVETVRTDVDGRYLFRSLPAGDYVASARLGHYQYMAPTNLQAKAGETMIADDLVASSPCLIRVRLIDDQTGQPLAIEKNVLALFFLTTGDADRQTTSAVPVLLTGDHFELRSRAGDFSLSFSHLRGEDDTELYDPIPFQIAGRIDVDPAPPLDVSFRLRSQRMAEEARKKHQASVAQAEQHARDGQFEAAIELLDEALAASPKSMPARRLRADARSKLQQYREAIEDYTALLTDDEVLEVLGDDAQRITIRNDLAFILATAPDESLRDGARAVELALEAVQLAEQSHVLFDTVAVAYAETGDFSEAIRWMEKAIALDPQREAYQRHLQLMRAGQPVRQEEEAQDDDGAGP
ncbi:carboxypeptidase-like regulatory domain-containing protein [Lacipirellula limnantheis]|uniref:carboxypeptidase-like regulatory domain-containing protein n=1 Tax=Lacipirellula limnantheis TaxID=2528024 RepID=UPI00143D0968|nr:carboxypeptidase-like regulatory domain-containing protein [Lacipirellula limnantheis]